MNSRGQKGYCDGHADQRSNWSKREDRSGSTTERGYGAAWRRIRERIMARDKGLCVACAEQGRVTPAKHVDHVIRKADGGTDDDANLQSLCVPCHEAKTANEGRGRVKSLGPMPK
ncbi:HNH endonuclease [Pseudomonas sp. JS3066]|uniref:HNH endonuclease n=1 Tax=Pseudomonas sp. JS3066 TaxID=3090665 RepID=UPI003FA76EC0